MKMLFSVAAISFLAVSAFGAPVGNIHADPLVQSLSHTNTIAIHEYIWRDEKRQRDVPVMIYFPETGPKPRPMVIFSHGLGGSREGYGYLGRYWAAHGFVAVHVQHYGSDTAIWGHVMEIGLQESMRRAVANLTNAINRPLDVSFAITRMLELNRDKQSPFYGKLNPHEIGVAGHSFGAFTTLAIAGEHYPPVNGWSVSFADTRVKAAIPMSSSAPADRKNLDATYTDIRIPCFHMTGTLDDSPLGETMAADRRIPFDHSKHADQYLVTFNGADHMTFAGMNGLMMAGPHDAEFQDWICLSSTVFWKAYLCGDSKSRQWLARQFQADLGTDGKVEVRLKQ